MNDVWKKTRNITVDYDSSSHSLGRFDRPYGRRAQRSFYLSRGDRRTFSSDTKISFCDSIAPTSDSTHVSFTNDETKFVSLSRFDMRME